MKIIFTAIMIATLAGCSTGTSTYFAQKDIDSIKKGVTSERSVLSMFGTPTSQSVDSQGNKNTVGITIMILELVTTRLK